MSEESGKIGHPKTALKEKLRCKQVLHLPMGEDQPCVDFRCVLTTRDHIDHSYEGMTKADGKIVWYHVDWEIES